MGRVSTLLWCLALGACRLGFDDVDPEGGDDGASTTARITIQHNGAGLGTVIGPNGLSCTDGNCTIEVDKGVGITLRGLPTANGWFLGWTNPCGGNFDCVFTPTQDATIVADFTPTPNRVFVTSTTVDGAFGGLAAADAICAARATAGGLSGTFVAYLSDSTTNAMTRIAGSRGWVRRDGAPFADTPAAFSTGAIMFPPRLDEFGTDLGNVNVYTGTNWGATTTANLCTDWTDNTAAVMGGVSQTQYASSSLNGSARACTMQAHLLCVETGRDIQVATRPNTGKLMFSTKNGWTPGGGRDSADAFCQSQAAAAGLPGTFLAGVATSTESIASRFAPDSIYRRVDDVRLLRTAGLFSVAWLDVPPEIDEFGALVSNDLWTGVDKFSQVALPAENCNDWTNTDPMVNGKMHYTTRTDVSSPTKADPCDSAVALLCFEP